MPPDPELDAAAREKLQRHIRKKVGVSALRQIRGLVDEYEEEERAARRVTPFAIALVVIAVIAVVLSIYVYRIGPAERARMGAEKPVPADNVHRALRLGTGVVTGDSVAARYSDEFRLRVEKAGTKAPQVIREKQLYGSTTLSTYIRDDGTVERIEVKQPSRYRELDDAAQKLVMLASPFPPFPADLKRQTDMLVITREFTFTKE